MNQAPDSNPGKPECPNSEAIPPAPADLRDPARRRTPVRGIGTAFDRPAPGGESTRIRSSSLRAKRVRRLAAPASASATPAEPRGRLGGHAAESASSNEPIAAVSIQSIVDDSPYVRIAAAAADDARVLRVSPLVPDSGEPGPAILTALKPSLGMEADAVAFAHAADVLPFSQAARHLYFASVRDRLARQRVPAAQLTVVDLLAAMFDYVIDDRKLSESAKSLVWRLQQPMLLLALLDGSYLGDSPRSIRRLMDNVGAITSNVGDQLNRGSELYRRLETLVRAVEVVSGALQSRSRVLAIQVAREYERCSHSVAQLVDRTSRDRQAIESPAARRNRRDYSRRPGRDQELAATRRLEGLIRERVGDQPVPASVDEFLRTVWVRYLRTTLLRDGESSNSFLRAQEAIDELLWTLDRKARHGSRRDLAQRIPVLISRLSSGLNDIGVRVEDHQAFFDELFLIHLGGLQNARVASRPPPPDVEPAPDVERQGLPRDLPDADPVDDTVDDTQAAPAGSRPLRGATLFDVHQGIPVLDEAIPATDPIAPADQPMATLPRPIEPLWPGETVNRADPPGSPDAAANESLGPDIEPTGVADSGLPMGGNRLLTVLQTIELDDLPMAPEFWPQDDLGSLERLVVGDWLEYRDRLGRAVNLKLAWINERRSVALLVRYPDRRAVSRSMLELTQLQLGGRLRIVKHSRNG